MPGYSKVALFSSLIAYVSAQQPGTLVPEVHPNLPIQICTGTGGTSCVTRNTKIVLDANWRWAHTTSGYTNCYTGNAWNTQVCSSSQSCVQNCALEGADYAGTYGITTSGNSLNLKFVTRGPNSTNVGSRVYLLDTENAYQMFTLNNKEFTFDVDVSQLPCGLNGALYFVEMPRDGGMAQYPGNKVGAKYGAGYCDAQCPHDIKWIGGQANIVGWNPSSTDDNAGFGQLGVCCAEMDIWEANSISNAYTPHTCKGPGVHICDDPVDCGDGQYRYQSHCDKDGCDLNPFRMGNREFYGPGKTVDTTRKMTVVTQFITHDGTDSGTLVDIRRFYVQNGRVFATPGTKWAGIDPSYNSIHDEFCNQQKNVFGDPNIYVSYGGNPEMGRSHARGHVLAMSLWSDHAARLLWLNSPYPVDEDPEAPGVGRGTCSTDSGYPDDMIANHPNASVTFSNIKYGSIGSTFADPEGVAPVPNPQTVGIPGGSPTTTTTRTTTTTTRTTTTPTTTPRTTTTRTTTTPTTTPRTTTPTTTPRTSTTTTTTTTTTTAGGAVAPRWGQCGGQNWTGPTACVAGTTCVFSNPWYSQCL